MQIKKIIISKWETVNSSKEVSFCFIICFFFFLFFFPFGKTTAKGVIQLKQQLLWFAVAE